MPLPPVRKNVTIHRVARFYRSLHRSLVFGYRAASLQEDDDVRLCTITGALALLASLSESLDVLCEIDARFVPLRDTESQTVERWKLMRHDGMHPADRVFREPTRANQNDPRMPNGSIYAFVFDRGAGTLQTGSGVLNMRGEIDAARNIGRQLFDLALLDWDDLR